MIFAQLRFSCLNIYYELVQNKINVVYNTKSPNINFTKQQITRQNYEVEYYCLRRKIVAVVEVTSGPLMPITIY